MWCNHSHPTNQHVRRILPWHLPSSHDWDFIKCESEKISSHRFRKPNRRWVGAGPLRRWPTLSSCSTCATVSRGIWSELEVTWSIWRSCVIMCDHLWSYAIIIDDNLLYVMLGIPASWVAWERRAVAWRASPWGCASGSARTWTRPTSESLE